MRETKLWTWHIIAGIVVLIFLELHMFIMHLDDVVRIFNPAEGEAAISWENVVARGKMVFFMITYIIMLGAALYHGLYGLRTIIFELNISKGLKKTISFLILAAGLGLFALGTWAAIAARTISMGA